jgi:predicted AAA+ superfamily ATPase
MIDKSSLIMRESYLERIRPFVDKDVVKVMTGIRRCGKSVMLYLISEDLVASGRGRRNILFVDFESESVYGLRDHRPLYGHIMNWAKDKEGKVYVFLDEVQEVASWELCVRSLIKDLDADVYVTGSNADMLSGELATHIAGRYVEFLIQPLTFKEHLSANRDASLTRDEVFERYLVTGGMPFALSLSDSASGSKYLCDVYDAVVLKDVVRRNNIRDAEALERLLRYMMSEIGHSFSAKKISDRFNTERRRLSVDAVISYLRMCEAAFLLSKVPRRDVKGGRLLKTDKRYCLADHGVRETVFGNNLLDIGQVLENIVYNELLHRGYAVTVGKSGVAEVDFVADRAGERLYVQVAYMLSGPDVEKKEFTPLIDIRDGFRKVVVSMDLVDRSRDGIAHMNVVDFLLGDGI